MNTGNRHAEEATGVSDMLSAAGAQYPRLMTLATAMAQTDRTMRCPEGIQRILYAASGSCTLVTAEKTVRLIGARMVFLTGGAICQLTEPSPDFMMARLDFVMAAGSCCGFSLEGMMQGFPELSRLCRHPDACIVFYDHHDLVMSAFENIHAFSSMAMPERDIQIMLELIFLLGAVVTCSWDEDLMDQKYNRHVRAALQYIHENYMCAITAEDVAAAAGINVGHLHRVFLNETGTRVGEYLTDLRIRKAKSLLMRTDISTTLVAHRVGISTLQYFCRLFKQKVGLTPQSFRHSYAVTCDYLDRTLYVPGYTVVAGDGQEVHSL